MSKSKTSKNKKDAKIMVAQLKSRIKQLSIQLSGQKRDKELRDKLHKFQLDHSKLPKGKDKPQYFFMQKYWDLLLELESLGNEAMRHNLDAAISKAESELKFAKERLQVYNEKVIE